MCRYVRGSGYCVGAVVDGSGLYRNTDTQPAASSSSPASSSSAPPASSPAPSPSTSTMPIQNALADPEDDHEQHHQQQGREEDGLQEHEHAKIGKRDTRGNGSGDKNRGGKGMDGADDNGMGDMWILGEPFLRGVDAVFDVSCSLLPTSLYFCPPYLWAPERFLRTFRVVPTLMSGQQVENMRVGIRAH